MEQLQEYDGFYRIDDQPISIAPDSPLVVSFGIVDDCEKFYHGPIHMTLKDEKHLESFVKELLVNAKDDLFNPLYILLRDENYEVQDDETKKEVEERIEHCSTWDANQIKHIAETLRQQQYYVLNRMQKYYVLAFALNYTRFEIYSKGCDKRTSPEQTSKAKVVHQIDDPDYNENPVIRLLKNLT